MLRYIAIVAVALMVFGGSAAYATPVTPGGTVSPDDFTGTTADAVALEASISGSWTTPGIGGSGGATGTYTTAVYSTSIVGVEDFVYQFSNSSTSDNSITEATALSFRGFSPLDVGFMTNGASLPGAIFVNGGPPPGSLFLISEDAGGSTVSFNMNVLTSQNISPGVTSEVLVIQAPSTHFTNGMIGLVAGGTMNLAGFEPSLVPEPSFFVPLGIGLLAAIFLGRRKLAART